MIAIFKKMQKIKVKNFYRVRKLGPGGCNCCLSQLTLKKG